MNDRYKPTEEDQSLFTQTVARITQVGHDTATIVAGVSEDEKTATSFRRLTIVHDIQAVSAEETFAFHVTRDTNMLKKLRSDKLPIETEIDLHGYRLQQAADRLSDFMHQALGQRRRVVRIVHGKGSTHGYSIIKSHVPRWLESFPQVLAYTSCAPQNGGTGAVKVLLKRARQ